MAVIAMSSLMNKVSNQKEAAQILSTGLANSLKRGAKADSALNKIAFRGRRIYRQIYSPCAIPVFGVNETIDVYAAHLCNDSINLISCFLVTKNMKASYAPQINTTTPPVLAVLFKGPTFSLGAKQPLTIDLMVQMNQHTQAGRSIYIGK